MTSLLEQKESLLRLQKDTAKHIEKLNREILFQDIQAEVLEDKILDRLNDISSILTHLRDQYGKIYKIEMGYLHGDTIDIKLIEPRGGPNGYARTIEKIEAE
jgi:hypothetical protein